MFAFPEIYLDSDFENKYTFTDETIDLFYGIAILKKHGFVNGKNTSTRLSRPGYNFFKSNGIRFNRLYEKRKPSNNHWGFHVYEMIGIVIHPEDNLLISLKMG